MSSMVPISQDMSKSRGSQNPWKLDVSTDFCPMLNNRRDITAALVSTCYICNRIFACIVAEMFAGVVEHGICG